MKKVLLYVVALAVVLGGGIWYAGVIEQDRRQAGNERLLRFGERLNEQVALIDQLFSGQKNLSSELAVIEGEYNRRNDFIRNHARERVEKVDRDRRDARQGTRQIDLARVEYGNLLTQKARLRSRMDNLSQSQEQKERMLMARMKDNSEVMSIKAKAAFQDVYAVPADKMREREARRQILNERVAGYESDMVRRNRQLDCEIEGSRHDYQQRMVALSAEVDKVNELIAKLKPRYEVKDDEKGPATLSILKQMDAELKVSRYQYAACTKVLCDRMELSVNDTGSATREMETLFDSFVKSGQEEEARYETAKTYTVGVVVTLSALLLCGIGIACWGPGRNRHVSLNPY